MLAKIVEYNFWFELLNSFLHFGKKAEFKCQSPEKPQQIEKQKQISLANPNSYIFEMEKIGGFGFPWGKRCCIEEWIEHSTWPFWIVTKI